MKEFIIADNQELTRYALEHLIGEGKDSAVYVASNRAGLVKLLTLHPEAVVILDYTLFDFQDEDQLLIVAERFSLSEWILFSDELSPQFVCRVVYSSQQFSMVLKDSSVSEVRQAIAMVGQHNRYLSQRAMETIIAQQQEEKQMSNYVLTQTETEIVRAIAQGKTTKEIAAERYLSVHTVTTHRKNIFRKLGINTAYEATKYALRAGLVDSSEFYI